MVRIEERRHAYPDSDASPTTPTGATGISCETALDAAPAFVTTNAPSTGRRRADKQGWSDGGVRDGRKGATGRFRAQHGASYPVPEPRWSHHQQLQAAGCFFFEPHGLPPGISLCEALDLPRARRHNTSASPPRAPLSRKKLRLCGALGAGRRDACRQGMRARKRAGISTAGSACIETAMQARTRTARRPAHLRAPHEEWTAGLARSLMGVTNDRIRRRALPC
jgi:hypothetical protein